MFELDKLIRPNIKVLEPYLSARDEYTDSDGIFLDANESPYGDLNRYPDPYQRALKQSLSKLRKVDPDRIFIGNGSDEAIDLLFRIFCEPGGDKALTFTPTYGMYQVSADINNIKIISIPLNSEFDLNPDAFKAVIQDESIKLVFICSPNNPTGNSMNREVIETMLNTFNGLVVIDEAYIDFSPEESWINRIDDFPNLVVMQTFSKAWGLAAARLGVAFASHEIIKLLSKVKPPYNISSPNQTAGLNALLNSDKSKAYIEEILSEKRKLQKDLMNLPMVKKIYPSNANFLLVEVDNANLLYELLSDQKIIVRNRHSLIKNCLRITVGTTEENQKLILTLKNINQ